MTRILINIIVVYLLIPTSNHNNGCEVVGCWLLYIFWFLHQTTTLTKWCSLPSTLYIFWFLHQTTTVSIFDAWLFSCISFDSYIKPQLRICLLLLLLSCISFDSYIKPQPTSEGLNIFVVVYLLIPTSNHNKILKWKASNQLYIFWFLHQTTTGHSSWRYRNRCISFDSYIKPQLALAQIDNLISCISFDSYIKPQLAAYLFILSECCISFDSYIKPQHSFS